MKIKNIINRFNLNISHLFCFACGMATTADIALISALIYYFI